jgi:hypothetical protein
MVIVAVVVAVDDQGYGLSRSMSNGIAAWHSKLKAKKLSAILLPHCHQGGEMFRYGVLRSTA